MSEAFFKNPKIEELLQPVLDYVENSQSHIHEIKQASSGTQAQKKTSLIGTMRGRDLFYPYLGRGIGRGSFTELQDGSVKLDFIGGIGVHILGHSHPVVIKAALEGALCDIVQQGHLQMNEELYDFQKKILEIGKRKASFSGCWITTSGSMANENAMKICRQKTKGDHVITVKGAFAGRTQAMLEITDSAACKPGLNLKSEALKFNFFDPTHPNKPENFEQSFSQFKKLVNENNISCFVVEPLQGEGGFNKAPREHFIPFLDYCKEKNIPIWFDEIQTFARTGEFFYFEKLGLEKYVDICTIAKTIQNGVTFWTSDYAPEASILGGTFASSSVSLRVGTKILEYLDENNFMGEGGRISEIQKKFRESLEELQKGSCKGLISDISGSGLMMAFTPLDGSSQKRNEFVKKLFDNGLLTLGCGSQIPRVRFLLPAVCSDEEIELAQKIIETSLQELS